MKEERKERDELALLDEEERVKSEEDKKLQKVER